MTKKFLVPRGTADILPGEASRWVRTEEKAREILRQYCYREIRTPLFEETDLFARSVGQTSDIVQKQMLNLCAQRGSKEEALKLSGLSLRPEGTAPIVRSYIQNSIDKKEKLSKLFYIGPMFRGERPQKGRLRQFHQIGVEVIGPDSCSPYVDAEIISLCVKILKRLGVRNFCLKMNTLGSTKDKKALSEKLRKQLLGSVSQLCPDCQSRFERNVFRILDCKNKACQTLVEHLQLDYSHLSKESLQHYEDVKKILSDLGISFEETMSLVRGLDYYTHTVFEVSAPQLGSQDALGAGGRYSHLVEQLGGSSVDAMGFALGIERILLATAEHDHEEKESVQAFVIALDHDSLPEAFQIVHSLRQRGIESDINFFVSSMKSQMRLANKRGARYVVILGDHEIQKGVVSVKDMETGNQEEVSLQQLKEEYRFKTI